MKITMGLLRKLAVFHREQLGLSEGIVALDLTIQHYFDRTLYRFGFENILASHSLISSLRVFQLTSNLCTS
ncbi:UNVERIFIED_CONTAM: hypothetical protein ABIC26_004762 [Paenibacillus sp. PvR008]